MTIERPEFGKDIHRAVGTGSTEIHVQKRPDNPGYWLFIGRKLWQDIGEPLLVQIDTVGLKNHARWVIMAAGSNPRHHTVSNTENDGMPRLTIGQPTITTLGLCEGYYPARVIKQSIHFRKPEQGLH